MPYSSSAIAEISGVIAAQGSTLDTVIDKATLDCLMNCDNWQVQVSSMLKEAFRVLRRGGK